MCGIVSFIGKSKNLAATYEFTTALLEETVVRGRDATGIWGASMGDGPIYYSKEPIDSKDFIKKQFWKNIKGKDLDVFIGHCRNSSKIGSENDNKNNHPFMSEDKNLALVHNGFIQEYERYKGQYDLDTTCDSEILLRMIESGYYYPDDAIKNELVDTVCNLDGRTIGDLKEEDVLEPWVYRLMGIKDIFTHVVRGSMAVSIGERWANGNRGLWLFRNSARPLYIISLKEELGQIFAFSDIEILRKAIKNSPLIKGIIGKKEPPIAEISPDTLWLLTFNQENNDVGVTKWNVDKTISYDYYNNYKSKRPDKIDKPSITTLETKIITNLNSQDEISGAKKKVDHSGTTANTTTSITPTSQANLPVIKDPKKAPNQGTTDYDYNEATSDWQFGQNTDKPTKETADEMARNIGKASDGSVIKLNQILSSVENLILEKKFGTENLNSTWEALTEINDDIDLLHKDLTRMEKSE